MGRRLVRGWKKGGLFSRQRGLGGGRDGTAPLPITQDSTVGEDRFERIVIPIIDVITEKPGRRRIWRTNYICSQQEALLETFSG